MPPSTDTHSKSSATDRNRSSMLTHSQNPRLRKKKRRKMQGQDKNVAAESNQPKFNELKKRLRDLIRLMHHKKDMSAGEHQYKQRELEALKTDILAAMHQKERKDMISRYHMVRFFERRKAERLLKQAQKRANSAPVDSPERGVLRDAVHEAEINLNYTQFYPLEEKYVSLFDNKSKGGAERSAGYKSSVWLEVETASDDRTALQKLRDRRSCLAIATKKLDDLVGQFYGSATGVTKMKDDAAQKDHNQTVQTPDDESSSEEGFFES